MKKILAFIFLISSFAQAQYVVKATMTPTIKSDWVILYKIEGAKQKFIESSKIKIDSVTLQGEKKVIGNFNFTLPKDAEIGAYRITYRLKGAGFVDFFFNKEDISFSFHPGFPNQSVNFSKSKENIIYKNYLEAVSKAQQTLDSIQVTALQNPNLDLKNTYKTAFNSVNSIQKEYLDVSKEMYIQPFIEASFRNSPSEISTTAQKYMSTMIGTFFNKIDFTNETLLKSSFLTDRIKEYVFYINYSDNKSTQQRLYKESVNKVLSKAENITFKKDIIEFLIGEFERSKNLEIIDYLFEHHYNKLPIGVQNKKFKEEKLGLLATVIGRVAPDFSWKEEGKTIKLSELKSAENYVLVFWSTGCSHCLKEIPLLHTFMQGHTKAKVIAFAMEKDELGFNSYKDSLFGWHTVLGLNKWENKTARTYNINSTPTYFILDINKKILAKPNSLKELKSLIEKL